MGDSPPIGEYLSLLSPSDASFDNHKKCACKTALLYSIDTDGYQGFTSGKRIVTFANMSNKIDSCGSWLKFVKHMSGKLKLIDARFCHSPNCPMCQWRRSLLMRAKFLAVLPKIKVDYPNHRWIFLTLTVKNCTVLELKETLKHMRESYNRFRKLADYPLEGYIRSIEVTRVWDWYDNNGHFLGSHGVTWWYRHKNAYKKKPTGSNPNSWSAEPTDYVHPHFHVLALVPASYFGLGYVKQERWTEMWQKSLRVEYRPVVDVRVVKPKKGKLEDITPDNLDQDDSGLIQGICETMKYTVKEQDLIGSFCKDDNVNSEWLKNYTQQMYKARRAEYSGILKNYKQVEEIESEQTENLITAGVQKKENDDEVERELVYRYSSSLERYIFSSERNSKQNHL